MLLFYLLIISVSFLHPAEVQRDTVKGIILDITNDAPIPDVIVKASATQTYATSDKNGHFLIIVMPNPGCEIEINHIGYKPVSLHFPHTDSIKKNVIIHLTPAAYRTETIVVSGRHMNTTHEDLHSFSEVLRGKELERSMGSTIASTLKNETGLSMRSMGPAPSRPVIRGLGGDRVVIKADGFTTVDLSSTSADHAVSLDPFTVDRIEVMRGPSVLLHGSSTTGGVVNAIRNEITDNFPSAVSGLFGSYIETVNNGILGAGVVKIPYNDLLGRIEFGRRSSGDSQTRLGVLKNSGLGLSNLSGALSYRFDNGYTGAAVRNFNLDYGVPGGFTGAHPNGVHINMFKREYTGLASVNLPSHQIPSVTLRVSRNYFSQTEKEANGLTGAEFGIFHYTGSIDIPMQHIGLFDQGAAGVSVEHRDFTIGGFVFTPPTVSRSAAIYMYQNIDFGSYFIEGSARYTYGDYQPRKSTESFNSRFIRNRHYNLFSFSLSGLSEVSDNLSLGINISKTSRLPSTEELYSAGPHLAAYSYETGNPDLDAETGYGAELFGIVKYSVITLSLNGFYNQYQNFIIPRNSGRINYATLLPVYETSGVSAVLKGVESEFNYKVTEKLTLTSTLSFTHGQFSDGAPLPGIPPLRNITTLSFMEDNLSVGWLSEFGAAQKRTDFYEQPTAGYGVHNVYFQYSIITSSVIHNLSLNAENLFNKEYRNHLSRIKVILPENGFNLRFIYKLYW